MCRSPVASLYSRRVCPSPRTGMMRTINGTCQVLDGGDERSHTATTANGLGMRNRLLELRISTSDALLPSSGGASEQGNKRGSVSTRVRVGSLSTILAFFGPLPNVWAEDRTFQAVYKRQPANELLRTVVRGDGGWPSEKDGRKSCTPIDRKRLLRMAPPPLQRCS